MTEDQFNDYHAEAGLSTDCRLENFLAVAREHHTDDEIRVGLLKLHAAGSIDLEQPDIIVRMSGSFGAQTTLTEMWPRE